MLEVVRGRRGPRPVMLLVRLLTVLGLLLLGLPLALSTAVPASAATSAVTLTGPTTTSATDSTPEWTVIDADGIDAVYCSFGTGAAPAPDLATWSVCAPAGSTGTFAPPALTAEGVYTLSAADYDGSAFGPVSTSSYTYDAAPVLTVTAPTGSSDETPRWSVSATDATAVTYTCTVTGPGATAVTPVDCTGDPTVDLTDDPEGSYLLEVTATDGTGNASTGSAAYVLDRVPGTVSVTIADPVAQGATAVFAVALPSPAAGATHTVACSVTGPAPVADPTPTCSPTTTSVSVTVPDTDGDYVLTVTVTDGSGSTSSGSATYSRDRVAPTVTFTGGPSGAGQDSTLTWSWTAVDAHPTTTASCSLTGAAPQGPVACTSPKAFTVTTDGTYGFSVVVTDDAGNSSAAATSPATYLRDTATPVVTLTVPASPSADTSLAGVTASVDDPDAAPSLQCRIDRTTGAGPIPVQVYDWGSCTTLPALTDDGSHTIAARATDNGQTGTDSGTYVLDRGAPAAVTITRSWTTPTNDASQTWSLSAVAAGDTRTCRFTKDSGTPGTYAACAASVGFPAGATSGSYLLEVRDVDAASNATVTAAAPVVLDLVAPARPAVPGGPSGTGSNASAIWTFAFPAGTPADAGVTFECQLRGPTVASGFTWQACATPFPHTLTDQGSYVLDLRARDEAGNRSAAPLVSSATYVYDSVAPPKPTVSGPSGLSKRTDVTWSFTPAPADSATDDVVSAVCYRKLNGAVVETVDPCSSPVGRTLAGDGEHVLEVVLRDAAGNTGEMGVSPTYTLDTAAPDAPVVSVVSGPSPSRTPSITWTWTPTRAPGPGRFECRVLRDGLLVGSDFGPPSPTNPCDTPRTDSGLQDGSYVLEVRVVDQAGNIGPAGASPPYVIDTGAPTVPTFPGAPTGPSKVRDATWVITTDAGTTLTCRLVRQGTTPAGFTACASPYSAAGLVDGSWTLEATSTDAAGNASTGTSPAYVVDNVGPVPTVSGPTGPSNVRAVRWTWTTDEPSATAECKLVRAGVDFSSWLPCTSPRDVTLPAGDATWQLQVRLTDTLTNVGAVAASPVYDLKTSVPAAPTVTSQASPSSDLTPVWSFTTETGTTAECRIDRVTSTTTTIGTWVPCGTPFGTDLTGLGDAGYVLQVRLSDLYGNTSLPGTAAAYVLDTTSPTAPAFTTLPTSPSQDDTPTWAWTSEAGSTSQCTLRLSTGTVPAWTVCSSPYTATLTSQGEWLLVVRVVDAAQNPSPESAAPGYVLDTTPPGAPVAVGPASPTNTRSATWSLPVVPDGATRMCRVTLDGAAFTPFAPCTTSLGPVTLGADGSYRVEAVDTDAAGNTGPVGTSAELVLDTVGPTPPTITGPVGPSQNRFPSWSIAGEAVSATCRVLRGLVAVVDSTPCLNSFGGDLTGQPDESYVLSVTTRDEAGNPTGPTSSLPYVLDTTAPVAPVVTGPVGPSPLTSPTFSWTGEPGADATCRAVLEGVTPGAFAPCSSPFTAALAADGSWTLEVELTDAAGNVSLPGSSSSYVLDTTPPSVPVVTPPVPVGRDRLPAWGVLVEPGADLECQLSARRVLRDWSSCVAPVVTDLTGLPDDTYLLSVRATDEAGLTGPVGSGSYALDTVAPAAPTVTVVAGGRSSLPSFSFTSEPGTSATCRLSSGTTVIGTPVSCVSPTPVDLSGLPDGPYQLNVRLTDAAGNTGFGGLASYVLDTSAPAAPVFLTRPASPSPDRAPVWTFRAESGSTTSCRLVFPTGAVRELPGCASPLTVDLSGLPDGTYTLQVRATDAAGNASAPAVDSHVLDASALAVPVVTAPASPSRVGAPVWRFTTPAGTSTECRLTTPAGDVRQDWTPCRDTYQASLFGQPDGAWRLAVRARTSATAVSAAGVATYIYDTTPPDAPELLSPPTPSTVVQPVFTLTSPETVATASCRLLLFGGELRTWAPCPVSRAGSSYVVSLPGDGSYVLEARVTDAAGNTGPVASAPYQLVRSAPPAVNVSGPGATGSDTTPTWTFSTAAETTLECRVTGPDGVDVVPLTTCLETFTADLAGRPDGSYALTVHAVNAAGAVGPDTTSVYELLTAAPDVPSKPIGPTGPSADRLPTWTFTLPAGTTGLCTVVSSVSGPFLSQPCNGTYVLDLTRAPEATYTLTVQALNAAQVLSPPSVPVSYVFVAKAPATPVFTQVPGSPSSTLDPVWVFTFDPGPGATNTAQCRLLQAGVPLEAFTTCTSPASALLSARPDGRYSLEVRAVNAAGASQPAVGDYVLDRTALPLPVVLSAPATPGSSLRPTWTFAVAPTGLTQECALLPSTSTFTSCATGFTGSLAPSADGTHLLQVRLVDASGKTGPAVTSTYVLDTQPPAPPKLVTAATRVGNESQVAWQWEAVTAPDLVECQFRRELVVASAWAPCVTFSRAVAPLGEATYALDLRTVDPAGLRSGVVTGTYRYDVTDPAAPTVMKAPAASGTGLTPTWTFRAAEVVTATCVTKLGGVVVDERSCTTSYSLPLTGRAPGTYDFSVRYVDLAGNSADHAVGRYVLLAPQNRVDSPVVRPRPPVVVDPTPRGPGAGPTGPFGPGAPVGPGGPPAVDGGGGRPDAGDPLARPSFPRTPAPAPASPSAPLVPVKDQAAVNNAGKALPDGLQVSGAIADAVTDTFKKPQLPLALLVIVVLFLLVQNRIDRRDPKLSGAPLGADDDLVFGPVFRAGGAPA